MIDSTALHARIVSNPLAFLGQLFGDELKPAGTDRWRVGRRGSLAIGIKDDALVYYCHESGQGGDAVSLWARQRGGTAGDALQACADWAGGNLATTVSKPSPRKLPPRAAKPVHLTAPQLAEAHAMCSRLAHDDALCESIARTRHWKPEIVKGAALDGALGWADSWPGHHQGALAFLYNSGIKHRWRQDGERMIRWSCGNGSTLWRGWMQLPATRSVFICEGETDALTMLSEGWEADPAELVVALSSAPVVPMGLGDKFAGLEVTLVIDQDDAGGKSTARLIEALRGRVANLKTWRMK